jgi:hypothetical protein
VAGKAGLSWSADTLTPAMKNAASKANFYLSRTTEYYSLHAETYAKSKAPWTDRTGNARSGLGSTWTGAVSSESAKFEIDIFHRMPYGFWLEVKHGGKFSIINKTVNIEGNKFFKTANQVMAKMFGGS